MKNLYDSGVGADIDGRLANLRADSQRQWGKMNLAQALAHCSGAMEFAVGDVNPPRMLLGGWWAGRSSEKVWRVTPPLRRIPPRPRAWLSKTKGTWSANAPGSGAYWTASSPPARVAARNIPTVSSVTSHPKSGQL